MAESHSGYYGFKSYSAVLFAHPYTVGMRMFVLCFVLLPLGFAGLTAAPAQQATPASTPAAPAGSEWGHVLALPVGTSVHIQGHTSHALCALTAVDAESISCARDTGVGHKALTFQRTDVKTIKLARRGRSAVLGGAALAGAGALAGGIQGARSNYFAFKGAFALVYGFAGAFAGAPIGYITDFSASTIYRAP